MQRNRSKKAEVVELQPLVACLPGYESVNAPDTLIKRLRPRFYHKSGIELRLEMEQRTKLLNWGSDV